VAQLELFTDAHLQRRATVNSNELGASTTRFLEHCRVARRLAAKTRLAYRADLAAFTSHFGSERSAGEIEREDVVSYVKQIQDVRGLRPTSARRHVASLRLFFAWLEREGAIITSPFQRSGIAIRLPRRLPRALSTEDMRALVSRARTDKRLSDPSNAWNALVLEFAVVVLFTTGLRVSELTSAELRDVSLLDQSMKVHGKGDRERTVYLGDRRTGILQQFLKRRRLLKTASMALLVTSSGKPLSSQAVRSRLRQLGERAGLSRRVTPHMIRHTAATKLIEAGVDIRLVQRLLGHASIATTQIYAHVSDVTLRERISTADTLSRLSPS